MRELELLVEVAKREMEKCRKCPLNLEGHNEQILVDEYQCDRKDPVQLDDGYYYCDGLSKLLYDIDCSYSIVETELK